MGRGYFGVDEGGSGVVGDLLVYLCRRFQAFWQRFIFCHRVI